MTISVQSDDEVLRKLRDKLRKTTDEELIRFGKEARRLAENPFQRQLEEARREWKRRKRLQKPNAEEVCSEKDRHPLEADGYAAASRRVGKRHDKPATMRAYLCPRTDGI